MISAHPGRLPVQFDQSAWTKWLLGKFNHFIHRVHESLLYVEDGRIFEATWLADLESSTVGKKNVYSNIEVSFHEVHDSVSGDQEGSRKHDIGFQSFIIFHIT